MQQPSNFLPKPEFDKIFSRVPRFSVELIVRTDEGIVLTKRSIEPCLGQWHIPGGTVLFGETLHDTVHRVANNELGVEVKINKLLGYFEYIKLNASGYKGWAVGLAFEVSITGGKLQASDQSEEVGKFNHVPENTIADQADFLNKFVFAS